VEIDGSGHREGLALLDDNVRQNTVSIREDVVLRYGLLALRIDERGVMDQVCLAYEVLTARRVSERGLGGRSDDPADVDPPVPAGLPVRHRGSFQ
jgi:hypothetical protein